MDRDTLSLRPALSKKSWRKSFKSGSMPLSIMVWKACASQRDHLQQKIVALRQRGSQNKFFCHLKNGQKNGQSVVESLFFLICILSFLSAVQFFQFKAREEIQKKRLALPSLKKKGDKKFSSEFSSSWYRPNLQKGEAFD